MPRRTPDRRERQLLQTTLWRGEAAAAAWRRLEPVADIDTLEGEAYGLLPLLHRRLIELAPDHPLLPRLNGVRRRTWYVNQLRLQAVGAAVSALREAGVDAVLAGGVAVLIALDDTGLRPLQDVDVFVSPPDADAALVALRAQGWSAGERFRNGFLVDVHGVPLRSSDGQEISLRWSSAAPYGPGTSVVPATVGEVSASVGAPAAVLLHTLVDGARVAGASSVRWLADAMLVAQGYVDWDEFVHLTLCRHAAAAVSGALDELTGLLQAPVPGELRELLARLPASRRDRMAEHWANSARMPASVVGYLRRTSELSPTATIRELPGYLGEVWDVDTPWRLPAAAGRRLGGAAHRVVRPRRFQPRWQRPTPTDTEPDR